MTTDVLEKEITESIANTCQFNETEKGYTCQICEKKLRKVYAGKPINERMLEHYDIHLSQRRKYLEYNS